METFTQIAKPHEDILEGRLKMDVFAADLWQVANGKAPIDYQDPDLFFKKTFITSGLRNILEIAKSRIETKNGDSIIQLQTPFGGGKTHTLIALYHKAKEWGAKVVVIDGTALDPKERRLWEEVERQLTGKVVLTSGDTSPGKEKLIKLFTENSPVLVLMDEMLEYITKAASVKVGDSNIAAQSFVFIQELTESVGTVGNALLVLSLPSSQSEHYDENAERMFQQLQKITGRMEKIYTPVNDEEIEDVVRARLFSKINERSIKKVVDEFVEHARSEGLLSENEVSKYRNNFLKSYPFKPEVIDILYKKWGSFPTFQRTRGVLRLLSLVVYSVLDQKLSFITLGDFDLKIEELRRELIKHIGQEWDSIIAQDITSENSGAKVVDSGLSKLNLPYKLGSSVSTAIFLMSFSGKGERGASIKDIKMSCIHPEFSSALIDTVINNLKEKLFYLSDEGLYFSNQANLNKILVSREENVTDSEIYDKEKEILQKHIKRSSEWKIYSYPKISKDVPDTPELKLVILNKESLVKEIFENNGESPRVYRNAMIFLSADENKKDAFYSYLRKLIALNKIKTDKSLKLTEIQLDELEDKLKKYDQKEYEELRKFYVKLFLPAAEKDNGFIKERNFGIPIYDEDNLDEEIDRYLKNMGEILEKIHPKYIKDKYLRSDEYIKTNQIYEGILRTPGEPRLRSEDALKDGIKEGVREGLFGFGHLENGIPICDKFKEEIEISLSEGEIIINPVLCGKTKILEVERKEEMPINEMESQVDFKDAEEKILKKESYKKIFLTVKVPIGSISTISKIVNLLKNNNFTEDVEITIAARDGEISVTDYEDKIKEALKQGGFAIEKEEKS